ncbi:zinc finger protein 880 [Amyelois transitella]|uniref:zinc finger protein 880 n=1 Tax=Amyelois transitella TaxID=680683 RepID=UPI0029900454|nr:zinc finger protein 880 [Amyelois transitella]
MRLLCFNNSLCRICLADGATLELFDSEKDENSIYLKITKCLKVKVEEVEGYPRLICGKCYTNIETVCNFVDTLTESSKILETGLFKNIKEETNIEYVLSDFDYSDEDVESKPNLQISFNNNELVSNLLEPLVLKIKKENDKSKQLTPKKKGKYRPKFKTNRIGSSMLEGEYKWDGETWSSTSNKLPSKTATRQSCKSGRKPRTRVKNVPKPKSDPTKLCDVCGQIFDNPKKLASHKLYKHNKKAKIFTQCPKCPKVLASPYYLHRHMMRTHDGKKDFICSMCGALFAYRGELTNHHKNVHEKNNAPKKTYKCEFCDKVYKCQKSVTIHERSVHTGERPAVCAVCNSTFFHEDYLKEHMRLHTGETPFKCPICGRGYAQRGNMKSHLRNHKVTDIEPEILSKLRPSYLKYLKDYR